MTAAARRDLPERIERVLRTGGTVVTATQRLSHTYREAFNRTMAAEQSRPWNSPQVLPFESWLHTLYTNAVYDGKIDRVLLTDEQESWLWEQVLREYGADSIMQLEATASLAMEADRIAAEYRLRISVDLQLNDDVAAFSEWRRRMDSTCAERGFLRRADLKRTVTDLVRAGLMVLPAELLFAGFDFEWPPAGQHLLEALRGRGIKADLLALPELDGGVVSRRSYPSLTDELQAAASWTGELLQRGEIEKIAVVFPDLEEIRSDVERVFTDILSPSSIGSELDSPRLPFDLSLGIRLIDEPVITPVPMILELFRGRIDTESFSRMLRSPYLAGGSHDLDRRALLDIDTRSKAHTELTVATMLRLAEHAGVSGFDGLREFDLHPATRLPSAWSARFRDILHDVRWPGARPLSSREYQARERFLELLDRFAALDPVSGPLGAGEALRRVRSMLQRTIFKPRAVDVPVQILGMLEAGGMVFDRLWMGGMTDEAWPPATRPNPFLPFGLQRTAGVPRSTPENTASAARHITGHLLSAAPEVVVSSSRMNNDREMHVSPLFSDLPELQLDAAAPETLAGRMMDFRVEPLQTDDSAAPPVEAGRAPGGTSLFKFQALCPFRAVAELRLRSKPPDDVPEGITRAEQGSLVHLALESFWKEVRGSRDLHALSPAALDDHVRQSVGRAIQAKQERYDEALDGGVAAVERQRLRALLHEWTGIEAQRPPFVVEELEARHTLAVGDVMVHTRIDRIDRLEDGGTAIIDYKTGAAKIQSWLGDRPEEPQLPLYAALADERPVAVAFAVVRAGKSGFVGLSAVPDLLPGVPAVESSRLTAVDGEALTWDRLFGQWREVLERIATEFVAGRASVDPLNPSTCMYCPQTVLCRRFELTGRKEEAGDE